VTGYILRWFTRPLAVTCPSTNPAVHGRELNSQPVNHKSNALTTTPPSHLVTIFSRSYCQAVVTFHVGSDSVTCHPTQVNTPHLNPKQTGWYSVYLPEVLHSSIGYWHNTLFCPSVCLSVTLCIVSKRYIVRQQCLNK